MEVEIREVRFDKYCSECESYNKDESEYPCDICLSHSWNENSEKPVSFKQAGNNELAKRKK